MGLTHTEKTKDKLAIGFSVERIGSKGEGKEELCRRNGIAVIDIGHMEPLSAKSLDDNNK